MRELYFMRHGESQANVQNLLCGSLWDVELTERGRNQVKEAAGFFHEVEIDYIISSPLKRAYESAKILADSVIHQQFIVLDDLKEQSYGTWEQRPFLEIKNAFLNGVNPPEGESHPEFVIRLSRALSSLKELEGRVLIVAHGGVGTELIALLGAEKIFIDNAKPIRLI